MHRTSGKLSWADMCRQRATDAKQRGAQAKDLSVKRAFDEVAAGWRVLAEQTERMDSKEAFPPQRKHNRWEGTPTSPSPKPPNGLVGFKTRKAQNEQYFPVCPLKSGRAEHSGQTFLQ